MGTSDCAKNFMTPCREACPAGVNVPRYIRFIREGRFDEALAVIRESIPFPAVCGHACVHPCEGKCARAQYDEPVAIRMLKRAAEENANGSWQQNTKTASPTVKKVAIIGSGPCGLTAAYYLAGLGHKVTVYEAMPAAGGMLRYGIPEYRLPNQVVDREIAAIAERGVEIKTGSPVNSAESLLGRYEAVFVATGAWFGSKIGAEDPGAVVLDGISFLRNVNAGSSVNIGKKVVVAGGGNTAIDAARASVRLGAEEVVLVYRRTRAEMPADPEEVKDALEEGVQMEFLASPVKIEAGKISCVKMKLGAKDSSGRPRPVPVEGSQFDMECDTVIAAVGQQADASSLGLPANANGTVIVADGYATGINGIFAAGDAITGPSSIIRAIAQGKEAAAAIDKHLGGGGCLCETLTEGEAVPGSASPMGYSRLEANTLDLGERLRTFNLVEKGYNKHVAVREAKRCLNCDVNQYRVEVDFNGCKACGYCKEVCGMGIFNKSQSFNDRGYQPMEVTGSDRCVGCRKCFFICPDFSISIAKVGGAE